MQGHGKFFSVKYHRNLHSRLVQRSMAMAIEATIARFSYMNSSLCHRIWLVRILEISLLVRIHVSRVLFSVPAGHFRRLIMPYTDNSQDLQIYTFSIFDHKYIFTYCNVFNFVQPGSCICYDMWRAEVLIFL